MEFTLLGIPNCDRVRNARKHMTTLEIDFRFRDIRREPLSSQEWQNLIAQDHENRLINTRSPSFRKTGKVAADLDEATKLAVLLDQPTAMKRPVLTRGETLLSCGFDPQKEQQLLSSNDR